ncbi:atrial natriuretic peptide-converting enzyme [Pundamilia nyererei]|uniref:Atrial natriuretic peptide-converting enzyme n=1 Tax=Pundamilia nyererei TaxID=303518 RepID=A0A9Y6MCG7_9CICH|nr:PREDICTED: atrial natriuretic peptide-converting enzyme [Pundamilia nyererei]
MLSARLETCPRVTFSGAGTAANLARGPQARMGGEACPHKLGSTNHLRLLLYILIPTVSLLAGLLLLVLVLTGIFGSTHLDPSLLPSPKPIADSNPGYHSNSTSDPYPSSSFTVETVTYSPQNRSESTPAATGVPPVTSSQAPPTQPYTTPPDWLASVTSLSTAWPSSTASAPNTGSCQLIVEPQCHMLPYNQTWLSSSVAVVKSSEVDMLLRFFSYLSRLSCYRHIMLFGCSLALPECIAADGAHNSATVCGGKDHYLCATGICIPQKLVCNGYNDCDDWSDETHCVCADGEFHCNTGRCLSPALVCDGYDDCGDLSDELNCVCDVAREHRCGDGRCVSRDWLCDGDHDCLDKSDELNCSCKSQGLLECRNGQCIPSAFRCDGEDDCKDGSDEDNCTVDQNCFSMMMVPSRISLHSALCVPARCEPISLELCMNLPYNLTSFPNYLGHLSQRESSVSWESSLFPALVQTGCYQYLMFYACTLLVPKCDPVSLQRVPPCRSLCRSAKEKCESVLSIVGLQWPEDSDCSQFPEEGGNTTCLLPEAGVDECSPSHFKCRSGRCVLASKRCDGHLDCDDHSDEDNCGCSERALWECPGSTVCIKASMICDGFPDCPQLVDETNCSVCRDNELSCNNHQCVHRTLWCDGKKHCSDSSDEWNCGRIVSLLKRWSREQRVSVLCTREECGLRQAVGLHPHRKKRILGGRVSRRGAWPWQCSLQSGQSGHVCGCVLIARKWALTVAHCFEGRESADLWKVVLGINNLDHPGGHSQSRGVRSIIVHPRYNRAVVDYDISIVELDSEIEETTFVRPVCLPQPGQLPLPDSYCYITGWGHMGNRMPFKLQEGEVRIISLSQCQSYFDMKTITPRMLCAGYEAGTVDSCMGDSGGPLVCEESSGRWTLFGLTSWGSVCFSKVLGPGVYSNVTHFTPWIQQQIYIHTYLTD